jgi:peptidoglycan/xylan/chitin deacetylase (PgdA/CDA1 family)
MRWRRDRQIVPVLMFHSVGVPDRRWTFSYLSQPVAEFEAVLALIAKYGFRTVGLEELFRHMQGEEILADDCVVLTFDDGYLDNWTHAVPLLRRHGMRAVVYVTPDFVQPAAGLRPTLEDVWGGRAQGSDLETLGFMNWDELRAAQRDGVLDIQSHALTHTWYPRGPRVVDIHRPREVAPYPRLAWNARPDRKPFYLNEDQQKLVPWGQPVFEHEKSLIVRRFVPDDGRLSEVTGFVADAGGQAFFLAEGWRARLVERFPELDGAAPFPGAYESDTGYEERVLHELTASRATLERELKKPVRFLSWPGGGVNERAEDLALEAGYKSWTLSSWQLPGRRNLPGAPPQGIKRIAGQAGVHWRGRRIADGGAWWVLHRMLTHQGSLASRITGGLRKLGWIAMDVVR